MPIAGSDLEFRYSSPAASGGNQLSQAEPADSIGGWLSQTVWEGGVKHDLFARVSGDENVNLTVEYRCLFVVNKHDSLTWTDPVVWFPEGVDDGAEHAVGVDPTAASALNATAQQALKVTSRYTAPAGVAFSTPTSKEEGVELGSIGPGECKAFWVRRSAFNTDALSDDGFTLRAEGDTA